ncbi:MAG: helix-turn-helix domain-containing protein [Ruminococcaceae bacterium]|nr:helix-turn-helix domain-containing protein [Oscillospiraceae bacterium]
MDKLIKKRRKELNITLEEIGNYVGVSKATVQRWETGGISNMRRDRIKKLSEILQINPQLLLSAEEALTDSKITEDIAFVKIPVLGTVAAGVPIAAQQDIIGWEEVPAEWTKNSTLFALKLKGDSMEPRMAAGDIVIVKKQSDVESGQIAIVLVGNEATCKKVVKHADGIVLISNNTKYAPMFFTIKDIEEKNITVLGRVIELRVKF